MKAPRELAWSIEQLVRLSLAFSSAFSPAINASKFINNHDEWTSEKLVRLSNSLSDGFMP